MGDFYLGAAILQTLLQWNLHFPNQKLLLESKYAFDNYIHGSPFLSFDMRFLFSSACQAAIESIQSFWSKY